MWTDICVIKRLKKISMLWKMVDEVERRENQKALGSHIVYC